MFTKIIACSLVLGALAALSAALERGEARRSEATARAPTCAHDAPQCRGLGAAGQASTTRFFNLLAMR